MKKGVVLICLFGLILAACGGAPPQVDSIEPLQEPTPLPIITNDDSILVQGHLVPAGALQLTFATKGQVGEVLVQEGMNVKAGDVIARLANQEQLNADVADAEMDLLFARQNYDDLQANLPQEQTTALEDLYVAQEALRQVQARVGSLSGPAVVPANQIEIARANVAIAKKALDKASNEYRPFANKPEDNLTRATLLQKLAGAQDRYNRAVARLNSLMGITVPGEEIDLAQNELTIAEARVAEAQAKYDLLLQGPDPKALLAADARIKAAETALAAAQAALRDLDLVAPVDGTVVNLNLTNGQYISEGEAVLMLVDFSKWYIETDTLVEGQVVDIAPGMTVAIVPDSLPNLKLSGVVETISSTFEEKAGKVTYTARIRIDDVDPRLRWGMKALASFESPVAQK
jgi:multidrug resistance efflux pump